MLFYWYEIYHIGKFHLQNISHLLSLPHFCYSFPLFLPPIVFFPLVLLASLLQLSKEFTICLKCQSLTYIFFLIVIVRYLPAVSPALHPSSSLVSIDSFSMHLLTFSKSHVNSMQSNHYFNALLEDYVLFSLHVFILNVLNRL